MRPFAVRSVSLEIEAGSFVALVGSSGAGKSTLALLLTGLYRPTSGRVLYDGMDLETLDRVTLRRQLGIVLQQPYLFADSIRSNIALGDEGMPLARVVEAAKKAKIDDFVQTLPLEYDTPISDGGSSLSGGQRQRVALARALVRRPSILLLDEATSHLDAESEREVFEELANLRATRLVIAHRLSTVVRADTILVMENGEIVEAGRHDDLLARSGRYAELVRAQLSA
jgi:ATP-binding cassette subfamily B protein